MIPLELRSLLVDRFKFELKNLKLNSIAGGERTADVKVYPQHLPLPEPARRDAHPDPQLAEIIQQFPYVAIRLNYGGGRDEIDAKTVNVVFVIGVYDESPNQQGGDDALIIANRIIERLTKSPLVGQRYTCKPDIDWSYYDEDIHPFFYAGLETTWEVPEYVLDDEELEELL